MSSGALTYDTVYNHLVIDAGSFDSDKDYVLTIVQELTSDTTQ